VSRFLTLASAVAALALLAPSTASAQPKHPRLHHAIHELQEARAELLAAKHTFGGHRKRAIHDINAAIKQLHLCLKVVGDPYGRFEPPAGIYEKYKNHRHLRHSLHELREARAYLRKAPPIFKGHKAKAIKDIDAAVVQIRLCIKHIPS
jgi:hypothetical protein